MTLLLWLSAYCPSSFRYASCHSWTMWLSELCTATPCLVSRCGCSSSSTSPHLSLPAWGWGRGACLIAPSGEGSFRLPPPRSGPSSSWGKLRYLWWSTDSWAFQTGPSMWRGGRELSEVELGRSSTRGATLVMWMSPAWSVETVPPALRAEEEDEVGGCPN